MNENMRIKAILQLIETSKNQNKSSKQTLDTLIFFLQTQLYHQQIEKYIKQNPQYNSSNLNLILKNLKLKNYSI